MNEIIVRLAERVATQEIAMTLMQGRIHALEEAARQAQVDQQQKERREMADLRNSLKDAREALEAHKAEAEATEGKAS